MSEHTKSALDHIENEISQIDQIVQSWSAGRTLRFDPAHVRSPIEKPEAETSRPRRRRAARKLQTLFNVLGFVLSLAWLVVREFDFYLSPSSESLILAGVFTFWTSGNLVLTSLDSAERRKRASRSQQLEKQQRTKTGKKATT